MKLDAKQRAVIRDLFFKRVTDAQRRTKIIQIASILSDSDEDGERAKAQPTIQLDSTMNEEDPMNDDFWAAIYHYSLAENWPSIQSDLDDLLQTI